MEQEIGMSFSELVDFLGDFCRKNHKKLQEMPNDEIVFFIGAVCHVAPDWAPIKAYINKSLWNASDVYNFVLGYKGVPRKETN